MSALHAQTQSWQWVKAGGSSSDNGGVQPAECKIGGCDAKGNVYAAGVINGSNVVFDTFRSAGSYSGTGAWGSFLLFSYDCSGRMRWAKQIGDEEGDLTANYGITTDPLGNTYFAGQFTYGYRGGLVHLYLGDSILPTTQQVRTQSYLCMIKYDSLGKLVWFKNFQVDTGLTPHVGIPQTVPIGLRIGSSGNLWMACSLDSNYAISSNLHTTKLGKYNVEVNPITGSILGGYFTSNQSFGDAYSFDTYYDMDENENYYEAGTLFGDFGGGGDTLILQNQILAPDTHLTYVKPYIYSLDKHGNFRFLVTSSSYTLGGFGGPCKYDFQTKRLVATWAIDTMAIYGNDTFRFSTTQFTSSYDRAPGAFCISSNGNILWGKYITKTNNFLYGIFGYIPIPSYIEHTQNNGLIIYDNTDTLFNKSTSSSINYYSKIISQINPNGKIITTHTAELGNVGSNWGDNTIKYGATDWRGNVYLGGTVSNYFATPADSVVNTDLTSGNFFIAKLGISDCSCPTPGAQFTQTSHGDTVHYFASSINHRDSIHWHFGDGSTSNKDTITHTYSHSGTYTVTAIAYSGCGVDSITRQVNVTTGIASIVIDKTNLYPNPVRSSVNLEVSGSALIGLVYANGATVWEQPVQVNQPGTYVFDMSRYASALYYFIVQYTNGKTDLIKVVKE
jgi:PKD repeat protein